MTTEQPTLPPAPEQAAEIEAMRLKLREAVEACTDLAMDYALQIINRQRAEKRLARAEQRIIEVEAARDTLLRKEAAGRPDPLRATVKEWADIAYEMWSVLVNSQAIEGQREWEQAKNRIRDRFHAALDTLPDSALPNLRISGTTDASASWWPQPDPDGKLTVSGAVAQAIGAASMCWEHVDQAGVFNGVHARRVHDGIMAYLSDWGDEIRRQANQATAAKAKEAERW